jgi:hypothetical protein
MKVLFVAVFIIGAVMLTLADASVTAGDCSYKYWGCGGMSQNDNTVTVTDPLACAAICAGRTSCSPSSPGLPYNCLYTY